MAFLNPEEPVSGKFNGVRNPNIGPDRMSAEAQAWQQSRLRPGGAPTAPASPVAPVGTAQRAGAAVRSLPGVQTALGVGGAAMKGARLVAGPAAVAGVVENFNDYKIDDPEVDSSVKGTFNALRSGDFDMAGRSLSKGALETAMDLGSGIANTLDYVRPGKAPVSTAYNQMLREKFGSLLVDNTPKPDAGAGRGYVNPNAVNPTAPTPAVAPTAATPAATGSNYSNEGRNYPTLRAPESAPDLTGKIVKSTDGNGNAVYTGSNIKAGADIVDKDGKLLNTNDPNNPAWRNNTGVSGPVNGPGGPGGAAGAGRSPMDIYANTSRINSQISEAARGADAYGPGGAGGGPATGMSSGWQAEKDARAREMDFKRAVSEMSPRQRAAAMMQQQSLRNQSEISTAQNEVTTRGQDINAGTARYGADISRANNRDAVSATLRGQDMDYAEKLDAKRLDLAARQADRRLRADIVQASGGDMFKAAQLAAANGLAPTDFLAVGAGVQAQGEKADAAGRGTFKNLFDTQDKDGKVVSRPDLEAQAYESVMKQTGNKYGSLPKEQQMALMTEAAARVRELDSARSRQNGTFGQNWLGRPNEPLLDSLPTTEQNAGSRLRHATPWDAFNSNIQMNDVLQTLPDGRVIARDPKLMTQGRLKQLEEQGARWEK